MHLFGIDEADVAGFAAHFHPLVHVAVHAIERDADHIGFMRVRRKDMLAKRGGEEIEIAVPRDPPEMGFVFWRLGFATERVARGNLQHRLNIAIHLPGA